MNRRFSAPQFSKFVALVLLLGSSVSAHEGHGTPGEGSVVQHYVTEPIHASQLALVILSTVVLVVGCLVFKQLIWRRAAER